MSDWKEYKLADVCTKIGSGSTPRGGGDTYLDSGEFALIRSQNVLDFTFSYNGLAYISEEQARKLNNVSLEEDDILLNITGDSVARVCQVPNVLLPARVNQHVAIIRPDNKIIDSKFLKYFLLNPVFKEHMLMLSSSGATRNAITKGMIENFTINAPDLATQTAIAEILSSLDDKIELNDQINKELEALAQNLFKQWFIDFEFPNENGEPYKSSGGEMVDSELGEIPKGWSVGVLGDYAKTTSGGTPSRAKIEYYENGKFLWVKSKELNNSMIFETEEKINEFGLKNSSAKLVPPYSVLIAMYGATVGQFGLIVEEATCNQAICAVLPSESLPYSFNYLFFQNYRKEFANLAVGSAQQNISQDLIKSTKLVMPPKKSLYEFHSIVDGLLKAIENNCRENKDVENLRNTLLPKLISGDLEVSDALK